MEKKVLIIFTLILLNLNLIPNVYAIYNGQPTHTTCYMDATCPAGLQNWGYVTFDYKCVNNVCTVADLQETGIGNQTINGINSQTSYISYLIIGVSIIIGFTIFGLILRVKRK